MYKSSLEIVKGRIEIGSEDFSCVYFLIKDMEIVYVGQALYINSRLAEHRRDGKDFDSYYVIECSKKNVDMLESFYIHTFRPKLNGKAAKTSDMSAPVSHINMYNALFPEMKCYKSNGVTFNEYQAN